MPVLVNAPYFFCSSQGQLTQLSPQNSVLRDNVLLIKCRYGSTKKMEVDANGKHCLFECSFGINLYTSADLLSWTFVGRWLFYKERT